MHATATVDLLVGPESTVSRSACCLPAVLIAPARVGGDDSALFQLPVGDNAFEDSLDMLDTDLDGSAVFFCFTIVVLALVV